MDIKERIVWNLLHYETISLSVEDERWVIKPAKKPKRMQKVKTNQVYLTTNLLHIIKERGEVLLGLDGYYIQVYAKPTITIILGGDLKFEDIKYQGLNRQKTPILEIKGKTCSGYTAISNELFGHYRKDIEELIKPLLWKEFDPEGLRFVKTKTYRGNKYSVYNYKNEFRNIRGIKGLQEIFPQLTADYIKSLDVKGAPADPWTQKLRHEELIEKFELRAILQVDGGIIWSANELLPKGHYTIKRELRDDIRETGETISRTVEKKMHDTLIEEMNKDAD